MDSPDRWLQQKQRTVEERARDMMGRLAHSQSAVLGDVLPLERLFKEHADHHEGSVELFHGMLAHIVRNGRARAVCSRPGWRPGPQFAPRAAFRSTDGRWVLGIRIPPDELAEWPDPDPKSIEQLEERARKARVEMG